LLSNRIYYKDGKRVCQYAILFFFLKYSLFSPFLLDKIPTPCYNDDTNILVSGGKTT